MKRWIGLMIILGSVSAQAAEPASWERLRSRIESDGTALQAENMISLNLEHVVPADKSGPHRADYVGEVGTVSAGKFVAAFATAVSEDWSVNAAGEWVIDQWIYTATLQGDLTKLMHFRVNETKTGQVLRSAMVPVPAVTTPEANGIWQKALEPWFDERY